MRRRVILTIHRKLDAHLSWGVALVALLAYWITMRGAPVDPFGFFHPTVALTAEDRRQLDRGEPIARILPGIDTEIGVFAAVPIRVDGDRLVAWVRRIDALKRSAYVLAIQRFSQPPRIEDLADLALDADELAEARACRPGHCALSLSPLEAGELGQSPSPDAAQQQFRRIILQRAQAYLADDAVAGSATAVGVASLGADMTALVRHSAFLGDHLPWFADGLGHARHVEIPDVESFLYWSKERLAGKAIVAITEVNIWRSNESAFPDALVAGKEFFATHYIRASLGVTALVRGEGEGLNYLVYVNRSSVDVLGGMWGGIVRWFVQRRLRTEAADVLQGLRRRLETGEPPVIANPSL